MNAIEIKRIRDLRIAVEWMHLANILTKPTFLNAQIIYKAILIEAKKRRDGIINVETVHMNLLIEQITQQDLHGIKKLPETTIQLTNEMDAPELMQKIVDTNKLFTQLKALTAKTIKDAGA